MWRPLFGLFMLMRLHLIEAELDKNKNCSANLEWSTANGDIIVNGQALVIKGLNYFGFESRTYAPQGLAWRGLNEYLDFIKDNNFNAIRVPISMEMLRYNPIISEEVCGANRDLCNIRAIRMLNIFIQRAAARGLLVVLSNHRHAAGGAMSPPLWYDLDYTEDEVTDLWNDLVVRYKNQWNVFAIDLKNDPHDPASWGKKNTSTDWNKAAERMIRRLGTFRGLFFVQGTYFSTKFMEPRLSPIDSGNVTLNNRVVYSPHSFGPDNDQPNSQYRRQFQDMPKNFNSTYMAQYGLLPNSSLPVVIGEWGGKALFGTDDEKWHKHFINWIRENCLSNNFYWALNPNSGHIGGLLDDDWHTPDENKLDLLKQAQPTPTKFKVGNYGQICITKGEFPNVKCRRR